MLDISHLLCFSVSINKKIRIMRIILGLYDVLSVGPLQRQRS